MNLESLYQAWEDSAAKAASRIRLQDELSDADLLNSDVGLRLRSGIKGGISSVACIYQRINEQTYGTATTSMCTALKEYCSI